MEQGFTKQTSKPTLYRSNKGVRSHKARWKSKSGVQKRGQHTTPNHRPAEKTLQHSTLTHILGLIIIQTTVITPLQGLSSLI